MGATPDFTDSNAGFQACPGIDWQTRGLWYTLTGRGTNIRLEYYLYTQEMGNSELSVYTGTCGNVVCFENVEGFFQWGDVNSPAIYEFHAEENEAYWLLLSGQTFITAGK